MADLIIVSNQSTKECRNYLTHLKRINFNNLANNKRLLFCFSHIKYQVFTSKGIQDLIGHDYILLY